MGVLLPTFAGGNSTPWTDFPHHPEATGNHLLAGSTGSSKVSKQSGVPF